MEQANLLTEAAGNTANYGTVGACLESALVTEPFAKSRLRRLLANDLPLL